MKNKYERVIPPKSAIAYRVKKGDLIRITDLEGKQTCDFVAFNANNTKERISADYSMISNDLKSRLSVGDVLYSQLGNPLLTILEDSCGVHDLDFTMCNWRIHKYHFNRPTHAASGGRFDGCQELLTWVLKDYGITKYDLESDFNFFMHTTTDPETGKRYILESLSKPGDYVILGAEMDLICGTTTCPEDVSFTSGGKTTSIKVEVLGGPYVKKSWKDVLPTLLTVEDAELVQCLLGISNGPVHFWSDEETILSLTLSKRPFKKGFKAWIRANIKNRQDLDKLSETINEIGLAKFWEPSK
jgi:uncharacterized protein YcgI (DUF1989 family)